MKENDSSKKIIMLFPKLPQKKGKTIGNPPKVQQMPFISKKPVKK
jgi:hypothetical protein